MVAVNVFAADTDAQARRLQTSQQQQFINLRRGSPGPLQPPLDDPERAWTAADRALLERTLGPGSVVGSGETVSQGLAAFIDRTGADELIVTGQIYDHAARLRSFEITAQVREALSKTEAGDRG